MMRARSRIGGCAMHGAIVVFVAFLLASAAHGQTGAALRALSEQVIERLGAAGGRAAVAQLERAGGRVAVEAALAQAEREGGEALAKRAAALLADTGAPALRVLAVSPARVISALDGLGADSMRRGLAAIEREPAILSMPTDMARRAVATEVRLPGVGASIVESLGDDGARVAAELTESQGISLARWSKDVAALPIRERGALMGALEKRPGVVLDYLDRHPGVLVAGTAVTGAAIIEMTALVSGEQGPVSVAVKGGTRIAEETLSSPLAFTITLAGVVAVALGALWFLPSVLRRWRRAARVA